MRTDFTEVPGLINRGQKVLIIYRQKLLDPVCVDPTCSDFMVPCQNNAKGLVPTFFNV